MVPRKPLLPLLLALWLAVAPQGGASEAVARAPQWTAQSTGDAWIFQTVAGRLHRHCQPDGPVGVVFETPEALAERGGPGVMAYTERCGPGWLIHLGTDLHGELLAAVLEHEWSHALSWDEAVAGIDHGPLWGLAMSDAYRAGNLNLPPIPREPTASPAEPTVNTGTGVDQ